MGKHSSAPHRALTFLKYLLQLFTLYYTAITVYCMFNLITFNKYILMYGLRRMHVILWHNWAKGTHNQMCCGILAQRARRRQKVPPGSVTTLETSHQEIRIVKRDGGHDTGYRRPSTTGAVAPLHTGGRAKLRSSVNFHFRRTSVKMQRDEHQSINNQSINQHKYLNITATMTGLKKTNTHKWLVRH